MSVIEEKTKEYERLVRRSEKSVEWLFICSTLVAMEERRRCLEQCSDGDGDTNDKGGVITSRELKGLTC
jgi:hypothetical protein